MNVFIPFTVLLIFIILYPFLAYKAIRFRARYSSYRNIRFHFVGELHVAYIRYLVWALLIPFKFGLIIPYIAYLKREYQVNFMLFGRRPFWFHGEAGHFFPAYFIGGIIMISGYVLVFIGLFSLVYPSILSPQDAAEPSNTKWIVATVFIYAVIMVAYSIGRSVIFTMIQNYSWQHIKMGGRISFRSNYRIGAYTLVQLTNLLAIVGSLGLAIPWATIRRPRFLMENRYITADLGKLGETLEHATKHEAAIGDAAIDYLDFDIGL